MNRAHRLANRGYEIEAAMTSRDVSRHGISKAGRRIKKVRNRIAKRKDAQLHFAEQEG